MNRLAIADGHIARQPLRIVEVDRRHAPDTADGSLLPLKYFHVAPSGSNVTLLSEPVGTCDPAATSAMRHFTAPNVAAPCGSLNALVLKDKALAGKPCGPVLVTTGVLRDRGVGGLAIHVNADALMRCNPSSP